MDIDRGAKNQFGACDRCAADGDGWRPREHGGSNHDAQRAGSTDPSYVLIAMGRTPEQAYGSVRFGVGRGNTEADIDTAVAEIARSAQRLRGLSTRVN